MEQITRKQHKTPKSYLKRFTNQAGLLEIFNVIDKRIEKPRHPTAVCYEKFFYGLETGKQDEISQSFEEIFRDLETTLKPSIDDFLIKILDGDSVIDDDKYALASFASMLYLRGDYMRQQINKVAKEEEKRKLKFKFSSQLFESEFKEKAKKDGRPLKDEDYAKIKEIVLGDRVKIVINNKIHLLLIAGALERLTTCFFNKFTIAHIAGTNYQFVTSDNALCEWFPPQISAYGHSFFSRRHFLPLSPKVLIEFRGINKSSKYVKRKKVTDERVLVLNSLIASHSQYLYSASTKEFTRLVDEFEAPGDIARIYRDEFQT